MKIAIIGSAPTSVRLAPYHNPEWKVWGCSPGAFAVCPRSDVWFEIHRWEPGQPWFSDVYVRFLQQYKGVLYVAEPVPELPNATVLPYQDLVIKYSPYFFTSTIAWMMALAIEAIEMEWKLQDEKGEPRSNSSIGLWGVDMAATEEYGYQRAGCQFFALLAKTKGIEVGVPPESDLLRPAPLYGICEISHQWIKTTARRRELIARLNDASARRDAAYNEYMVMQGAIDALNWQTGTWAGNHDTLDRQYTEPTYTPALVGITSAPIVVPEESLPDVTSEQLSE